MFRERYGFGVIDGGHFPDGLHNRVIPLANGQYLEILGISDPKLAGGVWLSHLIDQGVHIVGWGVQPENLDEVSARLGISPHGGGIGTEGETDDLPEMWRYVADPDENQIFLPFFIQYSRNRGNEEYLKWMKQTDHEVEPLEISWIEISGDADQLNEWLGSHDLPIRAIEDGGRPRIVRLGIRTASGEIAIS